MFKLKVKDLKNVTIHVSKHKLFEHLNHLKLFLLILLLTKKLLHKIKIKLKLN